MALTEKSREALEAILKYGSVTKAAKHLGLSIAVVSRRKQRAYFNYLAAKETVKEWEEFQARAPTILGAKPT